MQKSMDKVPAWMYTWPQLRSDSLWSFSPKTPLKKTGQLLLCRIHSEQPTSFEVWSFLGLNSEHCQAECARHGVCRPLQQVRMQKGKNCSRRGIGLLQYSKELHRVRGQKWVFT